MGCTTILVVILFIVLCSIHGIPMFRRFPAANQTAIYDVSVYNELSTDDQEDLLMKSKSKRHSSRNGKCLIRLQLKSKKMGHCTKVKKIAYCFINNHGYFETKIQCEPGVPCSAEVAEIIEDVGKCRWSENQIGCQILDDDRILTKKENSKNFEVILDGCYTKVNRGKVLQSLTGP